MTTWNEDRALAEANAEVEANPAPHGPNVANAITDLLAALCVPVDEHTAETPGRAARMWLDLLAGEREDPRIHLQRTFPVDTDDPGLIVQSGIHLQSVCAHHLLPFVGTATVAYRPSPGQQVVGLSKLVRLVHGYAARLQIQERIGVQVTAALRDVLRCAGAACLITATHDCMRLRGVRDGSAETTTASVVGHLTEGELALVRAKHCG